MEQLSKLVDFLASYPAWVKYLVTGLIFSIVILLIVFKPSKLAGLANWKLKVYDFNTFGEVVSKQRVGERLSGRILDDLLRRQLNAQQSKEQTPLTSMFSTRGPEPIRDALKAYQDLAPFVEVSGYIDENKSGDFNLHLRVTSIDADLRLMPIFSGTYIVSKDESNWDELSRSIGERIFALLSAMPRQTPLSGGP
jgi:hypothetical protein